MMANEQRCDLKNCPDHPHTVERLAMLEKGMLTVEAAMNQVVERLTTVRDQTMKELTSMRNCLVNEVLRRQSPWVTIAFSIVFGALCTVSTILIEHMLRN
jgi:hypothetical protein